MTDNQPEKLDSEDIVDEESQLMFGYKDSGNDTEPIELLANYLPDTQDYGAKTILDESHPELISALELLPSLYPEVQEFEDELLQFLNNYEKRLTSVDGRSRDEFVRILEALTGGRAGESNTQETVIESVLGQMDRENDKNR